MVEWVSMLFGDILRLSAQRHPNKTALICDEQALSYGDLHAAADRFANAALGLGLVTGDRIAIMSRNAPEYAITTFGAARSGCILVNLSPAYGPREISQILTKTSARALIIEDAGWDKVGPLLSEFEALEHLVVIGARTKVDVIGFDEFVDGAPDAAPPIMLDRDVPLAMTFTGGTTGLPKGAMVSHGARYISAYTALVEHEITSSDICGVVTPMYHAIGGFVWFPALMLAGCTAVMLRQWEPDRFADLTQRHDVSAVLMVPVQIRDMIDDDHFDAAKLASLRKIGAGGASASASLIAELHDKLPAAPFTDHYGQSETGPLAFLRPGHPRAKWETVGQAAIGVDLAVVDTDGHPVPRGETGEIIVKGDFLFDGYFDDPDETAAYFKKDDGWGWTGDLATIDDDGFITLVGRSKDMIISGGINVYPREVELVLEEHDAVAECTVFGVPDERWGEALIAYVVVGPGATIGERDLVALCDSRLARFKQPREVRIVESIPKTPAGKIQKRRLREAYLGEAPG